MGSGLMMDMLLKVFTLNVWGIPQPYPIGSKDRVQRIDAIAKKLASSDYDLVALQEIWSENDFDTVRGVVKQVLPFSHYFHSGFLGSGVCVFSRHPIIDAVMHRFSLNGFAHHVHRGDWFGGKVVGMVQVQVQDTFLVNFYTTHVHAEYDKVNDLYLPHRVVQAWEMSQFVKMTTHGADLTILSGDLNFEPMDLGYKIVLSNAGLKDAWKMKPEGGEETKEGFTCETPYNIYASSEHLELWPDGKRIDYVMYNHKINYKVAVSKCQVLRDLVPGTDIPISDHQAIEVDLSIQKSKNDLRRIESISEQVAGRPGDERKSLLNEAVEVIMKGEARASYDRKFFIAALMGLVLVIFYTLDTELSYPSLAKVVIPIRFLLTLISGFCLWYGIIGLTLEEKALKGAKASMELVLNK